jgi:hypothetical protein
VPRPPSRQPAQHPALSSALTVSRPTTICCTLRAFAAHTSRTFLLCPSWRKSCSDCPLHQQVPPKHTRALASATLASMSQDLVRYSWMVDVGWLVGWLVGWSVRFGCRLQNGWLPFQFWCLLMYFDVFEFDWFLSSR